MKTHYYVVIAILLVSGCDSKLIMNECNIFDEGCDMEMCEKFQTALITIQLSDQQYPISLHKVQASIKYMEEVTGIGSQVNGPKIPTYSNRKDMHEDIELWMNWFEINGCEPKPSFYD